MSMTPRRLPLLLTLALGIGAPSAVAQFTNFEATQVHPLRVSADGLRLYATATSDDRLVVFSLADPRRPVRLAEIPVGLRPSSLAERTADEVWVTNLLSDTVSVVDVGRGVVVDTLAVGDEPSDVAFAGGKAFVTAATEDRVVVFDAASRTRIGEVDLFCDEPRALAVDPSGQRVWALSRRSGNGTTVLPLADAPPQPAPTNPALPPAPDTGLIVRADDPAWAAHLGFSVPDLDLFAIDTGSLAVTRQIAAVGTTNFDLAIHPNTGEILVANTDARNLVRFVPNLAGHVVDSRVTRFDPGSGVRRVHDLNAHVDYSVLPNPGATASALADPTGIAIDVARNLAYVAAQGTDRIGVLDLGTGQVVDRIAMGSSPSDPLRGPRGVALHPDGRHLFVFHRMTETVGVVDTISRTVVGEHRLFVRDPVPPDVRRGRRFLYDARLAGNGTVSCASCHVDGEDDGLAWDLGDPGGEMSDIPVEVQQGRVAGAPPPPNFPRIHPMKGPLVTQTLRGMEGRPHWRGDLEDFTDFNATFETLMGGQQIAAEEMRLFDAWSETVTYPPNPNQLPDRALTPLQQQGLSRFSNGQVACISCHVRPLGTNLFVRDRPIGTDQPMKIAHLRNYYRKSADAKQVGGPVRAGFGLFKDGEAGVISDIGGGRGGGSNGGGSGALEAFLLAWDTGTAPVTGRQVHVDGANAAQPGVAQEVQLLESRAAMAEIDLAVRGSVGGDPEAFLFDPSAGHYRRDSAAEAPLSRAQVLQLAATGGAELVFVGVPPGEGERALDRDRDGVLDGDARAQVYGEGTVGPCGPAPTLAFNGEGRFGDDGFAIVVRDCEPNGTAFVVTSSAAADDVVAGVAVWVGFDASLSLHQVQVDARGVGVLPFPLTAADLTGTDGEGVAAAFHVQAFALDPCGLPVASAARRLRVRP